MKTLTISLRSLVKDNQVRFKRYRASYFFYEISEPGTGNKFEFPVPLEDIGDATLPDTDKAIMFMRYIRKAIEDNTFVNID